MKILSDAPGQKEDGPASPHCVNRPSPGRSWKASALSAQLAQERLGAAIIGCDGGELLRVTERFARVAAFPLHRCERLAGFWI